MGRDGYHILPCTLPEIPTKRLRRLLLTPVAHDFVDARHTGHIRWLSVLDSVVPISRSPRGLGSRHGHIPDQLL